MRTECCGRDVLSSDRYCPQCGWEFRTIETANTPVDLVALIRHRHLAGTNYEQARLDIGDLLSLYYAMERERNEARYRARILAHAYTTDNHPPRSIVKAALVYPVIPEVTD